MYPACFVMFLCAVCRLGTVFYRHRDIAPDVTFEGYGIYSLGISRLGDIMLSSECFSNVKATTSPMLLPRLTPLSQASSCGSTGEQGEEGSTRCRNSLLIMHGQELVTVDMCA